MSENEKRGAARQFEDLHMYQRARELTNAIYAQTRSLAFSRDYGLSDQIRRASVSIMSNIAEGFERGTTTEFVQFLYIAKGSCGEVRAQLQIALDQNYIGAHTHAALVDQARRISAMISNFIAHIQNSNYRGEKFTRPQRHDDEKINKWIEAGRIAQQANIRAQQQHNQPPVPSPPSTPAPPSNSSDP